MLYFHYGSKVVGRILGIIHNIGYNQLRVSILWVFSSIFFPNPKNNCWFLRGEDNSKVLWSMIADTQKTQELNTPAAVHLLTNNV